MIKIACSNYKAHLSATASPWGLSKGKRYLHYKLCLRAMKAGVFANADEPDKLERLCRYISRPAISEQHLNMTQNTKVRYELKTPYRDGTDYRLAHTYSLILSTSLVSYRPSFHHPDSTSPDFLACLRLTVIFAHKLQHRNVAKIALESLTKEMSNQINPIKQKV
jgi:hypothetical protein